MCGIFGFIGKNKINLYNFFMKIKHRGPDQSIYIDNNEYKIGFHRLAIHDMTINGMQPFMHSSENQTIYIYCNGEIYNYIKLKEEFKDYNFKSNSDCEILLPLYLKYGINFVDKLDGEFAIAIFDIQKNNKNCYIIRDRLGVRPLFYTIFNNNFGFCSELKGLTFGENYIDPLEPSTIMNINFTNINKLNIKRKKYYNIEMITPNKTKLTFNDFIDTNELKDIKKNINEILTKSVELRLSADVEIGCLLSGGLDSSLIASIASKLLKKTGKKLKTFCIGMKNSPDVKCALQVAEFINSVHTTVEIPEDEFLKTYEYITKITETYDITTNRATTAQYLISKYIKENTNIKVILVGDLSDEICSGYLYFHKAPNENVSHNENIRLLKDNYLFDLLRTDRGIAYNGLEARVPFASHHFINYYLSIYPILRYAPNIIEKWLLRSSFEGYLPNEILYRKKEAFSDGISSNENSWYSILQNKINTVITDEYFENHKNDYNIEIPSKEGLYIRIQFNKFYLNQDDVLKYYWMPKWIECNGNPSARVLSIY